MIVLYHRHCTRQEIQGLLAFYETLLGRKAGSLTPVMSQEGFRIGQRRGQSLGPRIAERVKARLAREGIELQGRALLRLEPPAALVRFLLPQARSQEARSTRLGTAAGTAGRTRAHLERKRRYLVARGLVASAEGFIERAASESSMSGTAAPVPSARWLTQELQRYRERATPPR